MIGPMMCARSVKDARRYVRIGRTGETKRRARRAQRRTTRIVWDGAGEWDVRSKGRYALTSWDIS